MGVICNDDGNNAVFVKGAPESVLARCSSVLMENGKVVKMTAAMRKKISSSIQEMSSEALRCLALAYSRALPSPLNEYDGSESHPGHAGLCSNVEQYHHPDFLPHADQHWSGCCMNRLSGKGESSPGRTGQCSRSSIASFISKS